MSPENKIPEPPAQKLESLASPTLDSKRFILPPPAPLPNVEHELPKPELIAVPPSIQVGIDIQNAAAGTPSREAFTPSRDPIPVERNAVPLTDAQVAAMSEAGAISAANFTGADPQEALESRQESIDREAAAAATRVVESSEPQILPPPPSTPEA